jgi:putative SOS response-associated peptidase YedK
MCGRYSNAAEFSEIQLVFRAFGSGAFSPRLNIAPTFQPGWEAPIVTINAESEREVRLARFWFIPENWRRPLSELPKAFNARVETLLQKTYFKKAAEQRRCLVPATGWREFRAGDPYHFVPTSPHHLTSETLFAFAGVHSVWAGPNGEIVDSFAILTCDPTPEAARVHHRMPLLLPSNLYDEWLVGTNAGDVLSSALSESQHLTLRVYASDRAANDARYEGPLAVAPRKSTEVMNPKKASVRTSDGTSTATEPTSEQLTLFDANAPLGSKAHLIT